MFEDIKQNISICIGALVFFGLIWSQTSLDETFSYFGILALIGVVCFFLDNVWKYFFPKKTKE